MREACSKEQGAAPWHPAVSIEKTSAPPTPSLRFANQAQRTGARHFYANDFADFRGVGCKVNQTVCAGAAGQARGVFARALHQDVFDFAGALAIFFE